MAGRYGALSTFVALAVSASAGASAASAQDRRPPFDLPPAISISAGAGRTSGPVDGAGNHDPHPGTVAGGSVDFALNRSLFLQAEVSAGRHPFSRTERGLDMRFPGGVGYTGDLVTTGRANRLDVLSSLAGRFGSPRIRTVLGVGTGIRHQRETSTGERVNCRPWAPAACELNAPVSMRHDRVRWVGQIFGGVDVRVTTALTAFASFRQEVAPHTTRGFTAGMRAAVRRASPEAARASTPAERAKTAVGTNVDVIAVDLSRRMATLVSLDSTTVTIVDKDTKQWITIPLTKVRRILRSSKARSTGTFFGLASGLVAAAVLCSTDDCSGDGFSAGLAMMYLGGIGAGLGTVVGAVFHHTGMDARTIYTGPGRSTTVLAPALGPKRYGIAGRIAW